MLYLSLRSEFEKSISKGSRSALCHFRVSWGASDFSISSRERVYENFPEHMFTFGIYHIGEFRKLSSFR
ncbi:hypothetical protein ACEPAG_538 [Sanghuangporus baumii]